MEKCQELGYRNGADCVEEDLKKFGYLPYDIVAVAYFLLKNNIDKAENLQIKENELNLLLSRAENLLDK